MKDKVDDRLREFSMPDLGRSLDNLSNTYQIFLNSNDKVQRLGLLNDLRNAAIDCEHNGKALLDMYERMVLMGPAPALNNDKTMLIKGHIMHQPGRLVPREQYLTGAFLQMSQLAKRFVFPSRKQGMELAMEKIQILYQMIICAHDISDLCLTTKAEPEKNLADA